MQLSAWGYYLRPAILLPSTLFFCMSSTSASPELPMPASEPALTDAEFERRLLRLQKPLRNYAIRLAGMQEADDLLQDVLLALWAARSQYTKDDNFDAWCHKTLRRKFLNNVTRPGFQRNIVLMGSMLPGEHQENEYTKANSYNSGSYERGQAYGTVPKDVAKHIHKHVDKCTPYSILEAQQVRDTMDQCLPPHFSLVLKLKVKGYNYEEICRLLGITYNAARARCFQARRLLRQHYEGYQTRTRVNH
jgi:RNA polymerase sigma factor (sigma-70 family)